jgi:hypothetical protein
MSDLKKSDLISALSGIDTAAEQVATEAATKGRDLWIARTLDSARFFSEPVRLAVDAHREEVGDATHESLLHEKARRLAAEFSDNEPSWEVRGWREVKRLETGERVFEVVLLGVDLPVEAEELIPIKSRSDVPDKPMFFDSTKMVMEGEPSDFCKCAHTRGTHDPATRHPCTLCDCEEFELLSAGVEGVEESPPDPHPMLTIPDVEDEGSAITFLRQFVSAAGLEDPDPETWMALQRLLAAGWRIVPPRTD